MSAFIASRNTSSVLYEDVSKLELHVFRGKVLPTQKLELALSSKAAFTLVRLPMTTWAVRTHCDGVKPHTCKSCIRTTPGTLIWFLMWSMSSEAGEPKQG